MGSTGYSCSTLFQCHSRTSKCSSRPYCHSSAIGKSEQDEAFWRNPDTGAKRSIVVYSFAPEDHWLTVPGVEEYVQELNQERTFLYDRNSKDVFGRIVPRVETGEQITIELNGRQNQVIGLTEIASSFGQEGSIITNRANFLRLFPEFSPTQVHVGLIRLKPHSDVNAVKEYYSKTLSPEVIVLTPQEFIDFELRYWQTNAPVGFVFTMGTIVGFFIGFIVVYQILYTDVSNHLPQFATMKAMGFTDNALLWQVIRQALLLAILGYLPGSLLAIGFYQVIKAGTSIAVNPTLERGVFLFGLTCLMCLLSGAMATRRLRAADPADVF
ncbi:MAG: ABC transporter permease DevC [Zavarzinella sp.]